MRARARAVPLPKERTATRVLQLVAILAIASALPGCIDPSDRRPGTRLSGEVAAVPEDWSFTDAHKEIAVEVSGFLGLPHSVTIWCGSLDGVLYLGARDPESKRWPGWVDRDPNVRLRVAGKLYEVRLTPFDDAARLERLRAAYALKYAIPTPPEGTPAPTIRYWRVDPRS